MLRMHRSGNQELTVNVIVTTYSNLLRIFFSCQCNLELGDYENSSAQSKNVY